MSSWPSLELEQLVAAVVVVVVVVVVVRRRWWDVFSFRVR